MGSPTAPAFADIFINYVIEKTKKFNVQPDVFFRYVDDYFAVFPDFESATLFYKSLNMGRRLSKIFVSFYKDKFCYNLTYLLQYDILQQYVTYLQQYDILQQYVIYLLQYDILRCTM